MSKRYVLSEYIELAMGQAPGLRNHFGGVAAMVVNAKPSSTFVVSVEAHGPGAN